MFAQNHHRRKHYEQSKYRYHCNDRSNPALWLSRSVPLLIRRPHDCRAGSIQRCQPVTESGIYPRLPIVVADPDPGRRGLLHPPQETRTSARRTSGILVKQKRRPSGRRFFVVNVKSYLTTIVTDILQKVLLPTTSVQVVE